MGGILAAPFRVPPAGPELELRCRTLLFYAYHIVIDRLAAVHDAVDAVHKIRLPVVCKGSLFDPLSGKVLRFDVPDKFSVADITETHSAQLSDNTVQLYTDEGLVTVNFSKS